MGNGEVTRVIVGSVAFVLGAALWFHSRARGARAAGTVVTVATLPRVGLAVAALGLSVLASSRPGVGWSVSSICFSVIAIVLIVMVLRDNVRRR